LNRLVRLFRVRDGLSRWRDCNGSLGTLLKHMIVRERERSRVGVHHLARFIAVVRLERLVL
jgi:hypothetical protein